MRNIIFIVVIGSSFHGFSQTFYDVIDSVGIVHTYGNNTPGGGISFYDFDHDGWDDLTFATDREKPLLFFKNIQGKFVKKEMLLSENLGEAKQVLWVDYDNDGDSDFFVTSFWGVNHLYNNDGYMNLREVTNEVGLPMEKNATFGATWGDYNNDGWLDLFITNYYRNDLEANTNRLFKNVNGNSFVEVTKESNLEVLGKAPFCASFFDFNNDGKQDIYIAQDFIRGNSLYRNTGNGTFEDISNISNTDLEINSMCVSIADFDDNGFQDIYVSNTPVGNKLLRNTGGSIFEEVAEQAGVAFYGFSWGANFLDYNNDGLLDLYVSGMDVGSEVVSSKFYENIGNGVFNEPTSIGFEGDTVKSFSNAIGDYNNDGFSDIAVNNAVDYKSSLWHNSGNDNNWIKLKLEGDVSNRDGVGTLIEVFYENKKKMRYTHCGIGFLAQNSQYELIGVEQVEEIDSIKVHWLSGHIDKLINVDVNQVVAVYEGSSSNDTRIYTKNFNTCFFEKDSIELFGGYYGSYLWSTGETTASIFVSTTDTISLVVTDYAGNILPTASIFIQMENEIFYDVIVENVSCYNYNDGSISVMLQDDSTNVYWSYSGADGNEIEGVGSGQYDYIIKNFNGCEIRGFAEINEPDSLIVDSSVEYKNGQGYITLNVTGGTPPYVYNWSHSEISEDYLCCLSTGFYNIELVDMNGCGVKVNHYVHPMVTSTNKEIFNEISIYPNPVIDMLNIDIKGLEGSIAIKIIDNTGDICFSDSFNSNINTLGYYNVNFSNFLNGIYTVFITKIVNGETFYYKVVKI